MILPRKPTLTVMAMTAISLLIVSAYANRTEELPLGIEIALQKAFYIPAATSDHGVLAVIKTPLAENVPEHEAISAVKLVPIMQGNKVKVKVTALIGNSSGITTCRQWDSLKSIDISTYVAKLDEEITITELRDHGVHLETGDLKFRVVPKKVFPQWEAGIDGCGCGSCEKLQCCPNPNNCIGCSYCGVACCY